MFDTSNLLPIQVPHAQKLLDSLYVNGVALDLSETGCGKTYVAAAVSRAFGLPVVVIAPKTVLPIWEKVLAKFNVKASLLMNYEKICRGGTPYLKYKKCFNEDRWENAQFKFPTKCLVILDEVHKCKGRNSLNAGLLIALKKQNYSVLCLSASAATNPMEMNALGYALNLHKLYDFNDFLREHGVENRGMWKWWVFDPESDSGKKGMMDIHNNIFYQQKIASRLTRNEMGSLFPENQVIAESYDMGPNSKLIELAYERMEREIRMLEKSCENYSGHILAIIMKERMVIEMLKVPTLIEMINDLFDEGKSVCVFVNFTKTIEVLKEKLEKDKKFQNQIGLVCGLTSIKDRLKDIDDFNDDRKRVMLCNIAAGGQSISLHDLNGKYPRASIINPSYSAINLLQALGRIHRQGGKTKCYQRLVYAAKTREEEICQRVQYKLNNLSVLNDGDLIPDMQLFKFVMGKNV